MPLVYVLATVLSLPPDLEEVVSRHEQGLGLIHSIKATIQLRVSDDSGQTWKNIAEYSVMRNGEYERVTHTSHFSVNSGYPGGKITPAESFRDSLMTAEGQRTIHYSWLDPEDLPSGTIDVGELASRGQGLTGQIDPPEPFVRSLGYKSGWLHLLLFLADSRFTLRELCEGAIPHLGKGKGEHGETQDDIEVTDPTRVRRYRLSLDPSHNGLIVRYKEFEVPEVKDKPIEWFNTLSVVDFHEPKKGIFVPKTIRGVSDDRRQLEFPVDVD